MKRKGVLCFITSESKLLLLRIDYGAEKVVWNGVSGYIDPGENAEEAVVREVKEEIGVDVDKSSLEFKGNQVVSDALDLDVFIATRWSGTPQPKEPSIKEVRWFDVDVLPFDQMIEGNKDWLPNFLK